MTIRSRVAIETGLVVLPNDPDLVVQLTSRRGWPDSRGRLQIETEADMRSRGLPSPDRADAVLGCMMPGYHSPLAVAIEVRSDREIGLARIGGNRGRGFQWDSDHPFRPTDSNRYPLL